MIPVSYTHLDVYKRQGYGLGLPIAKSIIDAHHGQVQIESNEVEGSCFQCILPLKNG